MICHNLELVVVLGILGVISEGSCDDDIDSWTVKIHPKLQKVPEGSMAIFTCESSLTEGVRFRWTKPTKPIKPKDEVEIIQVSPNKSVLKVEMASPKRHRRTYRCTVIYEDESTGVMEERNANAVLKVIGKNKLKDFRKAIARLDTWMTRPPGKIPLVCEMEGLWSNYSHVQKFTWFKDSVIDLSLEKDKWKLSEGMRILNVNVGSSGEFRCVAYLKKGSVAAYSNLLTLEDGRVASENIEEAEGCEGYNGTMVRHGHMYYPSPCEYCICDDGEPGDNCAVIDCTPMPVGCVPKVGGKCCEYDCPNGAVVCTDYRGNPVSEGDTYRPGDDPCEECLCTRGAPSRCEVAVCDAPPCRNYVTIPDTCCGFKCLDCFAYNGEIIPEGESYQPKADPCETCLCEGGEPTMCFNVACMKPRMPCEEPLPIPGECCKFTCDRLPGITDDLLPVINRTLVFNETTVTRPTDCVAYNGSTIREGQMYKPDRDACKTCICQAGRPQYCMMVACRAPPMPCDDPRPVPGECCKFTCDKSPIDLLAINKSGCVAYNGSVVREGGMYSPDKDPCETCICQNGRPKYCMMVSCRPPPLPCDDPRPVPGVCCKFTCDKNPIDFLAINKTGCVAYNGSVIREGQMYNPDKDPCKTCMCQNGRPEYCMMVRCRVPQIFPCDSPKPVPGECCKFICTKNLTDFNPIDFLALNKTECMSFNGTVVGIGMRYQPTTDPCKVCVCAPGEPVCTYFTCVSPPSYCINPQRIPNDCCGFTCNMTVMPGERKKAGYYSIPIRPVIQQIGPRVAMVQWEVPDKEKLVDMENVTINLVSKDYYGHFEAENGMDHIVVNGLNQTRMYDVSGYAYGKLRNQEDMRTLSQIDPVSFKLDTRATTSLNLRNAVGKVYESRGSYESGPYSLPRPFEEVLVDSEFQVTINLNTFNMVEMSSYVDTPCTKQECGLLRFYIYNMTGYPHNVMSLMFEEDLDFNWAKAHL